MIVRNNTQKRPSKDGPKKQFYEGLTVDTISWLLRKAHDLEDILELIYSYLLCVNYVIC